MSLYILNEKEFVRETLISKKKPDELSISYLATLIAKYYFHNCSNYEDLMRMVKRKIRAFDIQGYEEYRFHNKIENICKKLFETGDASFKELDYVPIYQSEIDLIDTLDSEKKKKVLFTFFAIARYMDCEGWINKKTSRGISEVFRQANVNVKSEQRNQILHELYISGYIELAKRINNLNVRVSLSEPEEIAYKVTEFKNLGYQYLGHFKPGYKQCANCGKVIKITGNRKKYCKKCAEIIKEQQKKSWREKTSAK